MRQRGALHRQRPHRRRTGDQLYVSCPEPAISAVLNIKSALAEDPVVLEGGFEVPLEDLTSAVAELRS